MISPDIMTLPAAGQDFYGKTAGEMMEEAFVDANGNVTGTFKHVTGYTGFNSEVTEEQEGYFFPFHLTKTGTTMSFLKNGEPGKEDIPWEADNVFRVTKGDTFEIKVDGTPVVTLSFDKATFQTKSKSRKKA